MYMCHVRHYIDLLNMTLSALLALTIPLESRMGQHGKTVSENADDAFQVKIQKFFCHLSLKTITFRTSIYFAFSL